MITICKTFTFEAAHMLPRYQGKCSNLHGHSYKLEIVVSGEVIESGPNQGRIMDFGDLKRIVENNMINPLLDHAYLNHSFARNPTAENMVTVIGHILPPFLPEEITLERIRLYETDTCYAEWRRDK